MIFNSNAPEIEQFAKIWVREHLKSLYLKFFSLTRVSLFQRLDVRIQLPNFAIESKYQALTVNYYVFDSLSFFKEIQLT